MLRTMTLLCLGAACCAAAETPFHLVRDGRPAAVLVVPENAPETTSFAAAELRDHARLATGAELPIITEDALDRNATPPAVFLGACQATARVGINVDAMARFEGLLKRHGADLFLAGRDDEGSLDTGASGTLTRSAGTLHAVYDLLDRDFGARWLWPGQTGIHIPPDSDLAISTAERVSNPWSLRSRFRLLKKTGRGWHDPANEEAFETASQHWLYRQRFYARETAVDCSHDFTDWWRKYGPSNPEFFQLLPDGRRAPLIGDEATGKNITMCVSNPALHRQIVDHYQSRDTSTLGPWARNRLPVGENDSPGMCTCPGCRAWDDPADAAAFAAHPYWGKGVIPDRAHRFPALRSVDGAGNAAGGVSLSNRYARFYLAVQELARKANPDVVVVGWAYANMTEPPRGVQLNENILISFVTWPYYPLDDAAMRDVRRKWDGWRATGARLTLRPNSTHSGANMPLFYARRLGNEFRYAHQHGMLAVDYDSLIGQWGAQSHNYYVLGRLNARPELTVEEILDEYCTAFGPAKPHISAYLALLEQRAEAVTPEQFRQHASDLQLPLGIGFKNWLQGADVVFSTPFFTDAEAILSRAAAAAADDADAAAKVAYLRTGLEHARRTFAVLLTQRAWQKNSSPGNKDAFSAAQKDLREYRAGIEAQLTADMGYLMMRENGGSQWHR